MSESQDKTPVYMIVMLEITDLPSFMKDYAGPIEAIHARHGAEVLVATTKAAALEGAYDKHLTVVLKFADTETQRAWYADPDYKPLIKRRQELTNTDTSLALLVPGFGASLPEEQGA